MEKVNIHPCVREAQSKRNKRARLQNRLEGKIVETKLFLALFMSGFISCGLIVIVITYFVQG